MKGEVFYMVLSERTDKPRQSMAEKEKDWGRLNDLKKDTSQQCTGD